MSEKSKKSKGMVFQTLFREGRQEGGQEVVIQEQGKG
jgi:hypothetical protein